MREGGRAEMGRSTRLLQLLRPYTPLFIVNLATTVVASVLDGVTFLLLIPFLRTLFGPVSPPTSGSRSARDYGILVGLSCRLALVALVGAPVLVVIVRPMVGKVRRR